jgi:hypothetical protein
MIQGRFRSAFHDMHDMDHSNIGGSDAAPRTTNRFVVGEGQENRRFRRMRSKSTT